VHELNPYVKRVSSAPGANVAQAMHLMAVLLLVLVLSSLRVLKMAAVLQVCQ
jgi:hypothetical protein